MGIAIAWPLANANKPVAAAPDKRAFEEPAVLEVTLERKSTLVHELVMP